MEINLSHMVWPVCVIRCNEALAQLQPGEDLTITVCDPDVVDNILLLIKSKPDLRSIDSHESGSYRITVHRLESDREGGQHPFHEAAQEPSYQGGGRKWN